MSQVLFPVVNWEVKCLTAGPSKLITIKKATRSEENTGRLQLTTCCDVTPGSQSNQTFLLIVAKDNSQKPSLQEAQNSEVQYGGQVTLVRLRESSPY